MALGIMLPAWGHTGHAIQLIISDATAGEENMFTTDQKLLYCTQYNSLSVTDGENTDQKVYYICRSARTCFTFVLVRSQALSWMQICN